MAEYVSEGLSEQGRRDMVSRIAAGGSAGYEVAETAKRPTADLAAAAEAAVAADPVDLGPGASAALSELTGGTMGSSSSYVDAQREIFERSRQRGGERGGQYYDDVQRQIGAQNRALGEYAADVEAYYKQLGERRSGGGGGGSSSWNLPVADIAVDDAAMPRTYSPLEMVSTPLQGPRQFSRMPDQEVVNAGLDGFFMSIDPDQIDDAAMLTAAYPDMFDDGVAAAQAYYALGMDKAAAEAELAASLDAAGMATYDAERMAGWIITSLGAVWQDDELAAWDPRNNYAAPEVPSRGVRTSRGVGRERQEPVSAPATAPATASGPGYYGPGNFRPAPQVVSPQQQPAGDDLLTYFGR